MTTHRIQHGAGEQTLRVAFVDKSGAEVIPSSDPTATIIKLRYSEDAATATRVAQAATVATLDSTSTTTDAIAGTGAANRQKISLTSVAGIAAGRRYLLRAVDGSHEAVTVDAVDTSSVGVLVRAPVRHSYPSGSSFLGLEASLAISADLANDADEMDLGGGPFAIDWTVPGVEPASSRHLLYISRHVDRMYGSVEDILTLDQQLGDTARRQVSLEKCLVQANRDVRRRLQQRGIDPDDFLANEADGRDLIAYRGAALGRLQMAVGEDDSNGVLAERWSRTYEGILNSLGSAGTVLTHKSDDRRDADIEEKTSAFGLV